LFAAALQPIVAPLRVLLARAKIIKLQAAKPAMIKLSAKNSMNKVENTTPHFVNLVDPFQRSNVLIAALWALGITRQAQT
jgi:hypothetical protein